MFPQASKKMLAQHLREMERDGPIIRTDFEWPAQARGVFAFGFGWFWCIAAQQHFDRMGLTICIIEAQARSYLQLIRVNSFLIADCESSPLQI
jgi:hypothetical protein